MRLAIAYSTKDHVELTKQSIEPLLQHDKFDLLWVDGSVTSKGKSYFEDNFSHRIQSYPDIRGGADAAIVFKLDALLRNGFEYTHVGLVENDVLLDADWLEPTLELFERGRSDGLEVGAVSARSYVDRVLIQRNGYAVMHNLGAGMVIFTRQAAELVLDNFRTHWWPHTRSLWMRLSGIDVGRYAAFRGNEQWTTSDWGYDALLASHGFASIALTPAKCIMIGQVPSLAKQGLELTTVHLDTTKCNDVVFDLFVERTRLIREDKFDLNAPVMDIDPRIGGECIIFPHYVPKFGGTYTGNWRLQWCQGFGPFAYRTGEGGASLTVPVYGTCSFMVSGGASGARCAVRDTVSGYSSARELPAEMDGQGFTNMVVPGAVTYRTIEMELGEGGVFYGYSSREDQSFNPDIKFDYSALPPV